MLYYLDFYIWVFSAPSFWIFNLVFPTSPSITFPKFNTGWLHLIIAFLEVQIMGKFICPVSAKMENSEFISSFSCGKNLNLISHVIPGEIRPFGV